MGALCETSAVEEQKAIEEVMTSVAKEYIQKQKAGGDESPESNFIIATEAAGIGPQLRELMSLPALSPEKQEALPAKLMLVDIPSDGAFYDGPSGEISVAILEKFLSDYKAGSLERLGLKHPSEGSAKKNSAKATAKARPKPKGCCVI